MLRYFLLSILLLNSFLVDAEEAYIIDRSYQVYSTDLNDNAIKHSTKDVIFNIYYELGAAVLQVFTLDSNANGNYFLAQEFELTTREDDNFLNPSTLIITGNYLLAVGQTTYYRFSVLENGEVEYEEKVLLASDLAGKTVLLDGELKMNYQSGIATIWKTDSSTGQIEIVFDYLYPEINPNRTNTSFIFEKSSNSILQVGLFEKDFTFIRYEVDLENQTFKEITSHSYEMNDEFDHSNNSSIYTTQYNENQDALFVRTRFKELIFKFVDANTTSLELDRDSDGSIQISSYPTNDFFIEVSAEQKYIVSINWEGFDLIKLPFEENRYTGDVQFLSETMVTIKDTGLNMAGLYSFENGLLTSLEQAVNSPLNESLPQDNVQSFYNPKSKQFMVSGNTGGFGAQEKWFYLWQYDESINDISFIDSTSFQIELELTNRSNVNLVGQYENNYYSTIGTNDLNDSATLVKFSLGDETLVLSQDKILDGSDLQSFFVASNTIMVFHFRETEFAYSLCQLASDGVIMSCTLKSFFPEYLFSSDASNYHFYSIENTDTFLFAPNRSISSATDENLKALIIKYDSNNEELSVLQTIDIPFIDSEYEYVRAAYTINEGKELIIGFSQAQHYIQNTNDGLWVAVDEQGSRNYLREHTRYEEDNYYVTREGRPYLYDEISKSFYATGQQWRLSGYNSWFQLTNNKQGFRIDVSELPIIETFTLNNTAPTIYKGNLPTLDIAIIQDVPVELNLGQYFINPQGLVVSGPNSTDIHPKLIWDGEFIRGTLTNEDMFFSEDIFNSQPADKFQVRVKLGSNTLGFFNMVPTNVNDAPVLVGTVGTQNLQVGQAYEAELSEVVKDPDRESVVYTYQNAPSGFVGGAGGRIEITINKAGTYTVVVTVTDSSNASLEFDLVIVVSKTGEASSGSGGGAVLYMIFLLLVISRVKNIRF